MAEVRGTNWTAANAVTIGRIALVPVILVALFLGEPWRWLAFGLFGLAAATDRLDGWLARRHDQVTTLGIVIDPIADKLLMGGSLVALSVLGDLPWWVTVVILVRELGITWMRYLIKDRVVLPASRGGKAKTVAQSMAIGMFVAPLATLPSWVTVVAWVLMAVALALTVVTGLDYVRTGRRIMAAEPPAGPGNPAGPLSDAASDAPA